MGAENRQKTLAALNDLWGGNPIRRTRAGEGAFTLCGRRLAVHLMVQPVVPRAFMADSLAGGTSFLPRFLLWEVHPDTMAGAIALAAFCLSEAARLADGAVVAPDMEQAERLRRWLVETWPEPDILPSDILRLAPVRALRDRPTARKATGLLVEAGWLVPLEQGATIRGKSRREAFRIVREASE